jgi:NAD(P)-dependent dehydrogenase (short-subunit alcohol dehydrogenase family)
VNAVAPGATETDMLNRFTGNEEIKARLIGTVPARRQGTPEEIAGMIVFIGSDEASYITGSVFEVDGGLSAA